MVKPFLYKAILVGALFILLVGSLSCSKTETPKQLMPVTLGSVLLEPSLPVFVAEDQGFFRQNGLRLTLKYYDVGLHAAEGVLNGEVNLSTPVSEYVLVGKVLAKNDLQTIGSIDSVDYAFVVGRQDRGVRQIEDLKGKKIGVVRGTILDFQLGRFMELHGMNINDVTLINGTLPQIEEALLRGEIDAAMTIPPFVGRTKGELGENAILWSAQNSQPFYSLIVGKEKWIKGHPDEVKRFLTAIEQAEKYIAEHPKEAKAILRKKLKFSDSETARVWSQNKFSLSIDQSLILAMEDEARWMIKNNLTSEKTVPDFIESTYLDGLRDVKPDAVSVIH